MISRPKPHHSEVESVLGLLMCVCMGTWVVPWGLDVVQQRVLSDVTKKLQVLEDAKSHYFGVTRLTGSRVQAADLVPTYLDRWPCAMAGRCADFKAGDAKTRATFRGVSLDEFEDPVTYQQSVKRLELEPRDFLDIQS